MDGGTISICKLFCARPAFYDCARARRPHSTGGGGRILYFMGCEEAYCFVNWLTRFQPW